MKLDDAVFGRDSIFMVTKPDQLDGLEGWGSFVKKIKKTVRKVAKIGHKYAIPKKLRKIGYKFEKKNRKTIKKVGAVAAVAVAAYYMGPAALKLAASMGGKSIATAAAKQVGSAVLKKQIAKKLDQRSRRKLAKLAKKMPPDKFIQLPEVQKLSQDVAIEQAQIAYPTPAPPVYRSPREYAQRTATPRDAVQVFAREGAMEVEHQVTKKSMSDNLAKFALPVASAITIALLVK